MTDTDIRKAIHNRYTRPQYLVAEEVGRSTGYYIRRRIDAIVIDLWPGGRDGLSLHAFEIKISRGDFKREIKCPEKSAALAQFCDFFSIVTPKGLLETSELPETWGLYEIDDEGNMKQEKKATKTEALIPDRMFLVSLLRAVKDTVPRGIKK